MNKVRLNGSTYLLPARWSDIRDRAQFVDICRALLEFETGLISFDEFRLSLTLAILRLKPEKLHASEALHENLFRIAELLNFPYTITEHPDGSRTAAITIRLEQNLLPQAGGVTGYKYVTDAAGIVDTNLTAAQYVEALAILPHVRAALSAGRDADPALDALAQTLYPGASGLSMDEKVAIFLLQESRRHCSDSFLLTMSRQEIADCFAVQKFSLQRSLKEFADEGIISLDGKHITILKKQDLVSVAEA